MERQTVVLLCIAFILYTLGIVWILLPNKEEEVLPLCEIDTVKWKLQLRDARPSHGINGPLSQNCLPEQTLEEFGLPVSRKPKSPGGTYPSQTGEYIFSILKFSGHSPIWTQEMWVWYMTMLGDGKSISVPDYPHSVEDLVLAYGFAASAVRDVAVFSSITPWAEASLHYFGAKSITSVDYNTAIVRPDVPVTTLSFQQIHQSDQVIQFDCIVSFSGIEHDGLGRYGDPINPEGDMSAMEEMWHMLRPGGVLFLGVPISQKDRLVFPYHRIYGPSRLERLVSRFTFKGYVWNGLASTTADSLYQVDRKVLDWQYQPVLVLEK